MAVRACDEPAKHASGSLLFLRGVQLADAVFVARRRDAEECVATTGDKAVQMRAQDAERPTRKQRREPAPAREHGKHFQPCPIALAPRTVRRPPHVHLRGQLPARVRRSPRQSLRVVIIEPHKPALRVQRLNARPHPTAQGALSVRVNLQPLGLAYVHFVNVRSRLNRFPAGHILYVRAPLFALNLKFEAPGYSSLTAKL